MALYNFIRNMWVMGRYTETQVLSAMAKGYITRPEAEEILALPQVAVIE